MEKLLRRWFVYNHGEGEPHQADVYRCQTCGKLRTWNAIRAGNVCCMGRLVPVTPSAWEQFKLLVIPWVV